MDRRVEQLEGVPGGKVVVETVVSMVDGKPMAFAGRLGVGVGGCGSSVA